MRQLFHKIYITKRIYRMFAYNILIIWMEVSFHYIKDMQLSYAKKKIFEMNGYHSVGENVQALTWTKVAGSVETLRKFVIDAMICKTW